MNPDQPSREQVEARLTALLLGELPAEEAELLRWTIARDPELQKLHDQLKGTMSFVREAMKNPTGAPVEKDASLKLSQERRQKLLAHFKTERPRKLSWLPRIEIPSRSSLVSAAIVILFICGFAAISIPNFVKSRATSQANASINNLRQIDAAKTEWALQNGKRNGAVVTEDDITPYIQLDSNGKVPKGPGGGTYVIGKVGEPATEVLDGKLLTASSGSVQFALGNLGTHEARVINSLQRPSVAEYQVKTSSAPGAAGAERVARAYQANPPAMAPIALPKTESTQETSQANAGPEVYQQNVVGYINVTVTNGTLATAAPMPIAQTPVLETEAAPRVPVIEVSPGASGIAPSSTLPQPPANSAPPIEMVPPPSPASAAPEPEVVSIAPAPSFNFNTDGDRNMAMKEEKSPGKQALLPPRLRNREISEQQSQPVVVTGIPTAPGAAVAYNNDASAPEGRFPGSVAGALPNNANKDTIPGSPAGGSYVVGSAGTLPIIKSDFPDNAPASGNYTFNNTGTQQFLWSSGQGPRGAAGGGGAGGSDSPKNPFIARMQSVPNVTRNPSTDQFFIHYAAPSPINWTNVVVVDGDRNVGQTTSGAVNPATGLPELSDVPILGSLFKGTTSAPQQSPEPYNSQVIIQGGQSNGEAKRQLDEKLELHQMLAAKIEADKTDATIPKSSPVTIVQPAQPGQSLGLWQRVTGQVESQARVQVNPDIISDTPSFGGGYGGAYASYDPYFMETELKSIQSDAVLGKVVDALKLDQSWKKEMGEKPSREDAIAALRSRLDLQTDKNNKEIEIGAKSDNPDEAAKIANAVAQAYSDYRKQMHRQQMDAGIEKLQQDYAQEDRSIHQMQMAMQQKETSASADNEMIPPGLIDFQGADVNQVLEVYSQLAGRTLLRTDIPKAQIVLKNETPMTRSAAIQTLQKALALQGLAVINFGDKFMKAVPVSEASTTAEPYVKPVARPMIPAPTPQPEIQTSDNAFSTFSLNVSDVSFTLAMASLGNGQMPALDSIRSEEFINAFDYHDPEPLQGQPLAFKFERARDPFAQERDLLRFSVKAAAVGRQAGRALNLVLLLDTSGSMERADRVAIIREALRVLAGQLQPQDTVSVVTFARTARLWADGVPGDRAGATLDKVGSITPEGGTDLEEALRLAYETASRHFQANGMNRVVLLTDGAANLGTVDPQVLTKKVEAERRKGIALDCFGIGWEDYNDDLLEQLSSNGDGRYAFINSPDEASTEFAAKLAGALQVAAEDVKVQVEFNPNRVTAWRQVGYAKHQLTKQQFRDNTVAAGTIASREAGNGLYVIETKPDGEGPIATVRVRYRVPGTQDNRERSWLVDYTGAAPALAQASPAMRLTATAAEFSEWLTDSPYAQDVTPDELLNDLSGVPQFYGADQRPKQLEWMIRQAKSVSGK